MSECICSVGGKEGDYLHSDYCPVGKDQRIAELEAEAEINHKLIVRQSDLLTGVANALRSEPGKLELHSHHDLPERAAALKEKARAAVNTPYEDILDMGLAEALRELKEVL